MRLFRQNFRFTFWQSNYLAMIAKHLHLKSRNEQKKRKKIKTETKKRKIEAQFWIFLFHFKFVHKPGQNPGWYYVY